MRARRMAADGEPTRVTAISGDVGGQPPNRIPDLADDRAQAYLRHEIVIDDDRDGASGGHGIGDEGEVILGEHAAVATVDEQVHWIRAA